MSNNSLKNNPISISKTAWYYEEPKGIIVIHEIHYRQRYLRTDQMTIPWEKIVASVGRKLKKDKK